MAPNWSLIFMFCMHFLCLSCSARLALLDSILWFSWCNFLHLYVTSSLLCPDTLLRSFFSKLRHSIAAFSKIAPTTFIKYGSFIGGRVYDNASQTRYTKNNNIWYFFFLTCYCQLLRESALWS
jgi:hypothetical protein